jgi:hypothetical protein
MPQEPRERSWGCLGVPAMVAAFAFIAFAVTFPGTGVLIGAIAVLAVYLIVGIALTQAKKRE